MSMTRIFLFFSLCIRIHCSLFIVVRDHYTDRKRTIWRKKK